MKNFENPNAEKVSSLEIYKNSSEYVNLLQDVIFASQDEVGSKLKTYLLDSSFGAEEESVYIIARYLLENAESLEGRSQIEKSIENLEDALVAHRAEDLEGSEGLAREYYRELAHKVSDFVINSHVDSDNAKEIISRRAVNVKATLQREMRDALRR